jgi:hypothetical protein
VSASGRRVDASDPKGYDWSGYDAKERGARTVRLGIETDAARRTEEAFPKFSAWVPKALCPSRAAPRVAPVILGVAASIITVVSLVFAILLMTLTLASMQSAVSGHWLATHDASFELSILKGASPPKAYFG